MYHAEKSGLPTSSCTILVATEAPDGRLVRMGTKYLPTIKDQKLNQRFQQRQNPLPKFSKTAATATAKKSKKK